MQQRVSRFRFHCTSLGLCWDGFPGNLLHGGIGMMLPRTAPPLFELFYGINHGEQRPRRWWLQPPLDNRSLLAPGDAFHFDLFFLDMEPGWLKGMSDAITLAGWVGLGKARGRFRLTRIEWIGPDGPESVRDELTAPGIPLGELLYACRPPGPVDRLTVHLLTPLQIKHEGIYLEDPPAAERLLDRLLARVSQLTGIGKLALPEAERAIESARTASIRRHRIHLATGSRYSARQEREMPFGGLLGSLEYAGELTAAYPWFSLAEWLQIGAKTTFGLGTVRIEPFRHVAEQNEPGGTP